MTISAKRSVYAEWKEFEAAGTVEVAVVDGGFARDDGGADGIGG